MIGKPIKGKSFGGCVRYVLDKAEAQVLYADGVRTQNAHVITQDFNFQRKLNPDLGKAVGHTVLSWSQLDNAKLSNKLMVEIAQKYMKEMGVVDTQYLIVRHTDKMHPHVHIIFNRVDNNGKTITDKNDYSRNTKACRKLTEAYGLHIADGKAQVNRQQLKGNDKLKYEIHDALKRLLGQAKSWPELKQDLQRKGIAVLFKYKSGTDQVEGVSFEKDGIVFKGSAIDRSMSLTHIDRQLRLNAANKPHVHTPITVRADQPTVKPQLPLEIDTGIQLTGELFGLLSAMLQSQPQYEQETPVWLQRKKPKKRIRW